MAVEVTKISTVRNVSVAENVNPFVRQRLFLRDLERRILSPKMKLRYLVLDWRSRIIDKPCNIVYNITASLN